MSILPDENNDLRMRCEDLYRRLKRAEARARTAEQGTEKAVADMNEACAKKCEEFRQHYIIAKVCKIEPGSDPFTICAKAIREMNKVKP